MKGTSAKVDDFEKSLLSVNRDRAREIVLSALEYGNPIEVAGNLVTKVLERIGAGWEKGDYSLSQVYMSGAICESIIDEVLPPMSPNRKNQPITAIGVFEDYHLLGKRIIYSSLRSGGFELIDLGGGLSVEKILKAVDEHHIEVLLLSVLMLPSALRIKSLIARLDPNKIKVVVGGAPFRFDPHLADEIGAYAMGKDSSDAFEIMKKLAEGRQ